MGIQAVDHRQELNFTDAAKAVHHVLKAGLVPMVRSSPGMGKSSMARLVAAQLNCEFIDIRLADHDPSDLNGLPDVSGEFATFKTFEMFPTTETALPDGKDGWVILFDELPNVSPQMQSAAYKVMLDRMVGQRKLHPQCRVMAAGNHVTDNAIAEVMSTALASRMVHINLRHDQEVFNHYMVSAGFHPLILAYLSYKPSMGHMFKADLIEDSFPCPRTWEFVNKLIQGQSMDVLSQPWFKTTLAGTIGLSAAVDFGLFLSYRKNIPSIQELLTNPTTVDLPQQPHLQYALSTLIAEHLNLENFGVLNQVVNRLNPELQSFTVVLTLSSKPKTTIAEWGKSPQFMQWVRDFNNAYCK